MLFSRACAGLNREGRARLPILSTEGVLADVELSFRSSMC